MRLAWFWIFWIWHKIAKKQSHGDLNQLKFSNSLAHFENTTKSCDKNVYFWLLQKGQRLQLACFLLLKTFIDSQNNCLKNCSSAEAARFTAFKKHIFRFLKWVFKTLFTQVCLILCVLALLLFPFEKPATWNENTRKCFDATEDFWWNLNQQFRILHKKQQPTLERKNILRMKVFF